MKPWKTFFWILQDSIVKFLNLYISQIFKNENNMDSEK